MTDDEMIRLDRDAQDLLRQSLPLLDAGRRGEATELVNRAVVMMQQVADQMNRTTQWINDRLRELDTAKAPPVTKTPS